MQAFQSFPLLQKFRTRKSPPTRQVRQQHVPLPPFVARQAVQLRQLPYLVDTLYYITSRGKVVVIF